MLSERRTPAAPGLGNDDVGLPVGGLIDPSSERARAPRLGATTVGGFAIMLGQTMGTKAVNVVGQIALAWLLDPEHFGLIGLAYTMTAFASLVQQFGLREVLVHRRAEFARLSSAAAWVSVGTAVLGTLLLLILAPVAAAMYSEPRLVGIILVLALATPFWTISIVPETGLQIQFRFRLLAAIGFGTGATTMALTVALAALGFGAYSFVLPRVIVGVLRLAVLWWAARPHVRLRPEWEHWRSLIGGGTTVFVASVLLTLISQGDFMILGGLHSATATGIYYFAFGLSMQAVRVLSVNLSQVLLPVLSRLQHEPVRQREGFLRAARLLTILAAPVCFLQAGIAEPLFRLAIDPAYYGAIAPLAALSVGMFFRITWTSSRSLIQALGRFKAYAVQNAAYATLFLALVAVGAGLADEEHAPLAVGIAVMGALMLIGPADLLLAIRPIGGRARHVARVFAPPALMGLASFGSGWGLAQLIGDNPVGWALQMVVTGGVGLGMYTLLVRVLCRRDWDELRSHARGLLRGSLAAVGPQRRSEASRW